MAATPQAERLAQRHRAEQEAVAGSLGPPVIPFQALTFDTNHVLGQGAFGIGEASFPPRFFAPC
jgi:hypothetical protein